MNSYLIRKMGEEHIHEKKDVVIIDPKIECKRKERVNGKNK